MALKTLAKSQERVLKEMYSAYTEYWETLISVVPEYKTVLEKESKLSSYYRQLKRNHLLFRPVGQLAFARAVQFLLAKKMPLKDAIKLLHSKNNMFLHERVWHYILWDPVASKMLNNWSPAETLLLTTAGQEPRSPSAAERLRRLQEGGEGT